MWTVLFLGAADLQNADVPHLNMTGFNEILLVLPYFNKMEANRCGCGHR